MNYDQIIGEMTNDDMREVFARLLDNMPKDDQVDLLASNLNPDVIEELYDMWSSEADEAEDEDETEGEEADEQEDEEETEKEESEDKEGTQ